MAEHIAAGAERMDLLDNHVRQAGDPGETHRRYEGQNAPRRAPPVLLGRLYPSDRQGHELHSKMGN